MIEFDLYMRKYNEFVPRGGVDFCPSLPHEIAFQSGRGTTLLMLYFQSSERTQPVIIKRIRENKNRPHLPPAQTPGLSCKQGSHYQSDLRMVTSGWSQVDQKYRPCSSNEDHFFSRSAWVLSEISRCPNLRSPRAQSHAPRRYPEKSFFILDLEYVRLCSKYTVQTVPDFS